MLDYYDDDVLIVVVMMMQAEAIEMNSISMILLAEEVQLLLMREDSLFRELIKQSLSCD